MSCCPVAIGRLKARLKRRDPCARVAEVDHHAKHRPKAAGVGEPEHARYLAGVRGLHELKEIGQVSEAEDLGYGPNRHVLVWILQQVVLKEVFVFGAGLNRVPPGRGPRIELCMFA